MLIELEFNIRNVLYTPMVSPVAYKPTINLHITLGMFFLCCLLDVDECMSNTHTCYHKCYNTEGSYKCDCHEGYGTSDDGFFCYGWLSGD